MAGLTWHRTLLGLGSSWLVACDCFCKLLPGGPALKWIWLQGGGLFVFFPLRWSILGHLGMAYRALKMVDEPG